jgi:hypothetical protein
MMLDSTSDEMEKIDELIGSVDAMAFDGELFV